MHQTYADLPLSRFSPLMTSCANCLFPPLLLLPIDINYFVNRLYFCCKAAISTFLVQAGYPCTCTDVPQGSVPKKAHMCRVPAHLRTCRNFHARAKTSNIEVRNLPCFCTYLKTYMCRCANGFCQDAREFAHSRKGHARRGS